MRVLACIAAVALVLICDRALAADEDAPNRKPVKVVADARLSVGGQGMLPLYLSSDWSMPLPAISRAIIVLHGRLRNADEYYMSAHTAQLAAGGDGFVARCERRSVRHHRVRHVGLVQELVNRRNAGHETSSHRPIDASAIPAPDTL